MTNLLSDGDREASTHLIFAHGAGAGMSSPWIAKFAALLADDSLCVHRFEFGYMAARSDGGSRRPPPKAETLCGEYMMVVERVRTGLTKRQKLFIGGKSMGGRVASMMADTVHGDGRVQGLVCIGYPFHPPNQPLKLRTLHLADLACPTLIVQGTRDPFGTRDDVAGYKLAKAIAVDWIENGDHDLKGAGRGVMERVADTCRTFMLGT